MELNTIAQLRNWLEDHCYNLNSYSIGGFPIYEGFILDIVDGIPVWCYTERGQREILKKFDSEKSAVEYAFQQITADPMAKRQMIGLVKGKALADLPAELNKRGIAFGTFEIAYSSRDDIRTGVYVTLCDIKYALDLRERYRNK